MPDNKDVTKDKELSTPNTTETAENRRMWYFQRSCAKDSAVSSSKSPTNLLDAAPLSLPSIPDGDQKGDCFNSKKMINTTSNSSSTKISKYTTFKDPDTHTDVHITPLSPTSSMNPNEETMKTDKSDDPSTSLSLSKYNIYNNKHVKKSESELFDIDQKYCYRHNPRISCNKLADKEQLTEIQKKLETLPRKNQKAVTNVWSTFSNSSSQERNLILQGLISQCCFPQLSAISHEISHLLKIDFLEMLPYEIALKVLCYLDCQSLCNAAQVSTRWKQLADDDRVWRYMCEQHIDRKCPQCGWGLPLMAVKKLQEKSLSKKRRFSETEDDLDTIPKPLLGFCNKNSIVSKSMRRKRPWKAVYSERYTVERNWRKGIYSLRKFEGHKAGVLCCQFDNNHLLMTGSYDKTIKIWNTDTGELIRTLTGHKMGIKSLVFDDQKLISAGLDSTIKVWNWRTGECISSYNGHREGVITVDFLDKIIVSGSADKTINVWHVDTRTCYTLRGHEDWVTCVKIHANSKCLFSSSDDSTIKLWDLETNKCIKTYGGIENGGHTAQVQCVIPFTYTEELITDSTFESVNGDGEELTELSNNEEGGESGEGEEENENDELTPEEQEFQKFVTERKNLPTHLITASLDNTIKLWDVKTGKCIRTQFGHIEGVWSIAADTFRIISGAHDKSIKVWDLQNGQCMHTFVNSSSVTCVGLGDSRIVCGLENGEVKMYCFDCN